MISTPGKSTEAAIACVVLSGWLAGCAGPAPTLRSEQGLQPAVLTGEEACRDPTALVLLCDEQLCAFYRCHVVALLENTPLEDAARGEVVLVRGTLGVRPAPERLWRSEPNTRGRDPVLVIPIPQPSPIPPLPPELQAEADRLARLPHARHHLFPQEAEFRTWFASKGIAPEAWTMPVLVEEYFALHAGAQGGLWNVAWRELMQAMPQATPGEVWRYAGQLCLRFGIFQVTLSGPRAIGLPGSAAEEVLVRSAPLDPALQARADKALAECADLASKEVLARRMKGRNPTPRECLEQVARDAKGQPITRAMQLGDEMHQVALKCAWEKLSKPPTFDFSIEQRYRYDPLTGRTVPVSPELEQALLRQGLGRELLGTIVPDVVLHTGNPARVQRVYDFKFPCVDPGGIPQWRKYPDGHPYEKQTQGEIYLNALGVQPKRVVPRWGVI